ncbi:Transcriptional regulatory protein ZraR [Aquisphaera giovannonii]|uniref:Transcriptional regulatory protein ZraR n=1 Tax=Aquisphaera giovannonii TaxID=406548 RepID=A0A5B9VWC6_9BACT|nr:sigma 54-interacting transcriptional regulator [Aquisphaera giovannonii]QEH32389.1 Transcriptional regulatory protein ZraR [Aquisphaera giovannonii]
MENHPGNEGGFPRSASDWWSWREESFERPGRADRDRLATLGGSWSNTGLRTLCAVGSVAVLCYSLMVLMHVAWMGTIGLRCLFGTDVKEEIPADFAWKALGGGGAEAGEAAGDGRPHTGDVILSIGGMALRAGNYTDYIQAMRSLNDRVGKPVEVTWRDVATGNRHAAEAIVRNPPTRSYVWSCIWFLQEVLIFAVGARVFWKRPGDRSARLFFVLCLVTVGAYMGGYHWTEIVLRPSLIYPFVFFALLVPVVNLHFFLVFPRENPLFRRHRRLVLGLLYGVPAVSLASIWGTMYASHWMRVHGDPQRAAFAERVIRALALGYIGIAAMVFALCIPCLVFSYRRAVTRAEKNQVKWILLASLIASVLIAYLLGAAWMDTSTLGRDSGAWPMFGVSVLYTLAYAFSITRYKLMHVEEIINRSVVYFAFSVTAGLIYSALLLVFGWLIRDRLRDSPTSGGAMLAAMSVVVVLILSEVARGRFQRVIDRRFFREKYKFDQAMQKMQVAVGSLVDRTTLGRRLLEGASEVLRVEWGALYLAGPGDRSFHLAACQGPPPDEAVLAADNPLVAQLRRTPAARLSHATATAAGADPATDAMIALGGEAAAALGVAGADGEGEGPGEGDGGDALGGLLVLGPKRSGMPFEDEEMAFLGALSSVATLALHSAGIQETLESLNQELRDKVDKIAEQQRRILILQEQLRDRAERGRERDGAPGDADDREASDPRRAGAASPADRAAAAVFGEIRGSGPAVREMIATARKAAASPSAVLIRGESGTGKELLAAAIHAASPRAGRPFVKVHCAALSQNLLESELFGHVRGAFTGADRNRVGRFEEANGGTLFLDEIGDINLEVQTKLLRVLQEMSFERVGSSQPVSVDVRIVAATHQDLEALIRDGRFREDLFYRLNVIPLRTPALRRRKEDIIELAGVFLARHAERMGKPLTHIEPEAVELLMAHDWPGNVRELENVIERAVVLADGPAIGVEDLPPEVREPARPRRPFRGRLPAATSIIRGRDHGNGTGAAGPPAAPPGPPRREASTGPRPLADPPAIATARARPRPGPGRDDGREPPGGDEWNAEFLAYERQRLTDAMAEAEGNKSVAARLLGMPRSTFFSKLRKHGLA